MKKSFTSLIVMALACGSPLALAASQPGPSKQLPEITKKKSQETYSATEEDLGSPAPSSAPGMAPVPVLAPSDTGGIGGSSDEGTAIVQVPAQEAEAPKDEIAPPPPPTSSPRVDSQATFDTVPENQVEPLVKRLKLMEQLITKHKRAYDYRALTTKDLQAILQDLENPKAEEATN